MQSDIFTLLNFFECYTYNAACISQWIKNIWRKAQAAFSSPRISTKPLISRETRATVDSRRKCKKTVVKSRQKARIEGTKSPLICRTGSRNRRASSPCVLLAYFHVINYGERSALRPLDPQESFRQGPLQSIRAGPHASSSLLSLIPHDERETPAVAVRTYKVSSVARVQKFFALRGHRGRKRCDLLSRCTAHTWVAF